MNSGRTQEAEGRRAEEAMLESVAYYMKILAFWVNPNFLGSRKHQPRPWER